MPKEPVIFTRMGADTDHTQAVFGASSLLLNGTQVYDSGGVFGYCQKFEQNNGSNYLEFNWTPGTAGAVEFWVKPNGWSLTNTTVSDGNYHFWLGHTTLGGDLMFLYAIPGGGLNLAWSPSGLSLTTTTSTWSSGTWYHCAFYFNYNETNGSALLQDGNILAQGTLTYSMSNINTSIGQVVRYAGQYGGLCFIDNFKYYNYKKTDFSDRFDERGGLNDQIILA